MADEDRSLQRFKEALKTAFGNTIRKPISVGLGYKDDEGNIHLRVPEENSDAPRRYYFHELTGQPFVGEAYMREGAVGKEFIRYNMPVRVKKDEVDGEWVIVGIDARLAAEFLGNLDTTIQEPVDISRITYGLLTQTTPPSMQAQVLSAAYTYLEQSRFFDTQLTVDFSEPPYSENIPTTNGRARFVLVQLDGATGELDYKIAEDDVPNILTFQTVAMLDSGNGNFLPQTDSGYFRVGYLKLFAGMTSLVNGVSIFPLQEYLFKTDIKSITEFVLSAIVVSGGEVVTSGGHVVWSLPD